MKIYNLIDITQGYSSGEGLPDNSTDICTVTIRAACCPEGPVSLLGISREK